MENYRTNTLLIKGLESKTEPDLQWIQTKFAETGLFEEDYEIQKVSYFTARKGFRIVKIEMISDEAVTRVLQKRRMALLKATDMEVKKVKIFPHRPRSIREALTRKYPRNRYQPVREVFQNNDEAFYHLNWNGRQQSWQPQRFQKPQRPPWY